MGLLVNHFNAATVPGLMCRSLVSVDHDGRLFDCDFNQALGSPAPGRSHPLGRRGPLGSRRARDRPGSHCFGCTAGHGSSCGGALTS